MQKKDIIKKPIITEKSLSLTRDGFYTFEVDPKARKNQLKKAIEEIFKVNVITIKTINYKAKKKRSGRRRLVVKGSIKKKAIVKVKPGQKIDLFETT